MLFTCAATASLKALRSSSLAQAQAGAGGLIGVGRADAAQGGADLVPAARGFLGGVEGAVGRGDQVGGVGDAQPLRADLYARRRAALRSLPAGLPG